MAAASCHWPSCPRPTAGGGVWGVQEKGSATAVVCGLRSDRRRAWGRPAGPPDAPAPPHRPTGPPCAERDATARRTARHSPPGHTRGVGCAAASVRRSHTRGWESHRRRARLSRTRFLPAPTHAETGRRGVPSVPTTPHPCAPRLPQLQVGSPLQQRGTRTVGERTQNARSAPTPSLWYHRLPPARRSRTHRRARPSGLKGAAGHAGRRPPPSFPPTAPSGPPLPAATGRAVRPLSRRARRRR